MLETYSNYVNHYMSLGDEEKNDHKAMLRHIIDSLNDSSGNYPVLLGLFLADNSDFSVLLSGDLEPLNDAEFKKQLTVKFRKMIYGYQKRLAVICELCLEDDSMLHRFRGKFTSFDNISCIAELMTVPFGTLKRLQKCAVDRRHISKLRSVAGKLNISIDELVEMIDKSNEK